MVLLIVFLLICVICLIFTLRALCTYNWYPSQTVEKFTDAPFFDISEHDERVYFDIIELYEFYLNRHPSEEELGIEFGNIKTGRSTVDSLSNKLRHSIEYLRLNDPHDTNSTGRVSFQTEHDVDIIKEILIDIMPRANTQEFSMENIHFLISKFNSMHRNRSAFVDYYKKLPEYADYCEMEKRKRAQTASVNTALPKPVLHQEPVFFTEDIEEEDGSSVDEEEVPGDPPVEDDAFQSDFAGQDKIERDYFLKESEDEPAGVSLSTDTKDKTVTFTINRPNLNRRGAPVSVRTTRRDRAKKEPKINELPYFLNRNSKTNITIDDNTCAFYRDFYQLQDKNTLANLRNSRNLDELKFHCNKETTQE